MTDIRYKFRQHLLGLGFVPQISNDGNTGKLYTYHHEGLDFNVSITVDVDTLSATAEVPDYEYNKKNVYANKNTRIDFTLDMKDTMFFDFDKFFDTVVREGMPR